MARYSIAGIRTEGTPDNERVVIECFDAFKKPFEVRIPARVHAGSQVRAGIPVGVETAVFANVSERTNYKPLFAGQIGVQMDTRVAYIAGSTDIGDWSALGAAQTAEVAFTSDAYNVDTLGDPPDDATVLVELTTNDGEPLQHPVTLEVIDAETGDAVDPTHYTKVLSTPVTFPIGAEDGDQINVPVAFVKDAAGMPKTIDLALANLNGAAAGTHAATTVTLTGA
jgi:hypothetical protein